MRSMVSLIATCLSNPNEAFSENIVWDFDTSLGARPLRWSEAVVFQPAQYATGDRVWRPSAIFPSPDAALVGVEDMTKLTHGEAQRMPSLFELGWCHCVSPIKRGALRPRLSGATRCQHRAAPRYIRAEWRGTLTPCPFAISVQKDIAAL